MTALQDTTAAAAHVVRVDSAYPCGELDAGELLQLAAAVARTSGDPVDTALVASVRANRPDLAVLEVPADEISPATPQRPYSLLRVATDKGPKMVMRGECEAVLAAAAMPAGEGQLVRRNAQAMRRRGLRPMAVATAPSNSPGSVGPYTVQGVLGLAVETPQALAKAVAHNPAEWVRLELWSLALRLQHWLNVALIVIMSATGYLIMQPGLLPAPAAGADSAGYLMGVVRFVHFMAAFIWIAMAVVRVGMALTSRTRQQYWRSLWPLWGKKDVLGLWDTIRYYLFMKRHAPVYIAHNPLQQFAYTGIYVVCIVQIITGLALFGLANQYSGLWEFLAMPVHWFGIPIIRLWHTLIMFVLWAFVIIHIYLAVRADATERHGGISSMINGGVWVRRGTHPVDAPPIG